MAAGLIAGAAVAAGAYAGGAALLSGSVAEGTTVHGVDIGGLGADEAGARLAEGLGPVASAAFKVQAGGKARTVDPAAAGLGLDVPATVEGLAGYTLDPAMLWTRLAGGGEAPPVLTVDRAKLDAAVAAVVPKLEKDPAEGSLEFRGTEPVLTAPVPGVDIDPEAAADAIAAGWFGATGPVALPVGETAPLVPAAAFEDAASGQAEPLVAGGITVTADSLSAELSPAVLAANASFKAAGGKVSMVLDNKGLAAALVEANPAMGSTAKDARIVLSGGRPTVVASENGTGTDTADLAAKVLEASSTERRTVSLRRVATEPDLTTGEAEALGVDEVVVEFSTPYPTYDTVRTKNLVAGARKLNGLVVMPGQTFSLQQALGPVTTANGFHESGVVVDGFSSNAVGGGLSQISTQMFNIGFLAGMDDIEHQPHSRWFDRYPAGREATLWEGQIDMKWKNNTDYAVMIQAWVAEGRVHSRLWGTKVWDVKTTTSEHYNLTNPTTVYNTAEDCVPESGGQKGFTVTVTRSRSSAAQTLPAETLRWTYRPWNKVVCGPEPKDG
ncbi:vanomycin resistance protein VanB [Zafaria cholistanensis]|uniref:Vanomycin resistance protein VanB n=2 Tax=Zafaria cholistanensis TaxID=1682741 RepID=A0A5A7NPG2_9MICC|nr:vanomycin resistance protein VanB [Zafaria cholistanensis]